MLGTARSLLDAGWEVEQLLRVVEAFGGDFAVFPVADGDLVHLGAGDSLEGEVLFPLGKGDVSVDGAGEPALAGFVRLVAEGLAILC